MGRRTSRYKGRGWHGESHRHYLASKGISTKRISTKYLAEIRGEDLPMQRHFGEVDELEEIKSPEGVEGGYLGKPRGGFWTSSIREDNETDWEDWANMNDYDIPRSFIEVEPNDDARIFQIEDEKDLEFLWENYGEIDETGDAVINWKRVSEDFDAVNVTEDAVRDYRIDGFSPGSDLGSGGVNYIDLYSWDAESTAWFNDKFKIKRRGRK